MSDLIREPRDPVTGEFPAIADAPMPRVWERRTSQCVAYFIRFPSGATTGSTIARFGADAASAHISPHATDAQLRMLGFVPCADPLTVVALTAILEHVPGGDAHE
jgi:hypothetical protein